MEKCFSGIGKDVPLLLMLNRFFTSRPAAMTGGMVMPDGIHLRLGLIG